MRTNNDVQDLVATLRSKDGHEREETRNALIAIGKPAVPRLLELLSDPDDHVRWEVCKALGSIRDPSSAEHLVHALEDESVEVQWLAAEALIALGNKSVTPLLRALTKHFNSVLLRQGAHHVLHSLEREKKLKRETLAVLDLLRGIGPVTPIALAAHKALETLRKTA
jgi:HEAT repeat protein